SALPPSPHPRCSLSISQATSVLARPQVAHYLVHHSPGACKIRGGQRNGSNLGVAAAPISLADAGKIVVLRCCVPWVAAHTNLDSRLRAAQGHAVNRLWKQIIRNKLIETFEVLVQNVEE